LTSSIQLNFTRGALTPLMHARIDIDHYRAGLRDMSGWTALRYGGMTRTPGTVHRGFAKEDDRTARFLPFVFNRAQAYVIEAGHLYFRFWNRDTRARVEDPPGTPVEVVTPYAEADLKYIQVRQSGDLVFIFCRGYWPRVLTRTSEAVWGLALYGPDDGPYLDINLTATTLDPSGTSGSVTLTASAITGINGGAGFLSTDVGRPVRFLEAGGRWYWFLITAYTSTTVVTATFMGRDDGDTAAMPGHAASANWRLGAWAAYEGYPKAVGLYEERLVSASTTLQPATVWGTVSQDTGLDDYSFQSPLAADDAFTAKLLGSLNSVEWIADGKDIILGAEGSLRVLGRNDEGEAFGPTNMRQKPESAVTTSYVPGFFIDRMLVFLDATRTQLYEATYTNEAQGLVGDEISALNEHLFNYGVTSLAYQKVPNRVLWCTTDAGPLLGFTYDRGQEIAGCAENPLGGDGVAEWVMSIPGIDRDGDQVWMIVRRTIDGEVRRSIETLAAFWRQNPDDTQDYPVGLGTQAYPVYAHCAGVYEGTATSTLTGLEDFEGETYGVWADGVDLGDVTVQDGELVLPDAIEAEAIVYGLRKSSLARTLRLSEFGTGSGALALGRPTLASEATIDIYQTGFLRVGMGLRTVADYDNGLDPIRPDDISEHDPYDAAPLRTEALPIKVDDSWDNNGVCTVETNSMHPATVLAIMVDVEGAD
jgi:hypothetical protein